MTPKAQAITLGVHGLIALSLIAATSVLAWHKTLDGQAVIAIFGLALGLFGGSASTLAAAGVQQNAVRNQAQIDELSRRT